MDAAHDLDEPGGAGVDDARLLQHGQHLARLRDACRRRARRSLRGRRRARPRRPSTGSRSASSPRPASSPRGRRRRSPSGRRRARSSLSASDSVAPRTICDRITPELPRAPISAARETSCASAGAIVGAVPLSASTIARTVSVRFVPVSPSGHRIDVQVVDPAPAAPRSPPARRCDQLVSTRCLMRSA